MTKSDTTSMSTGQWSTGTSGLGLWAGMDATTAQYGTRPVGADSGSRKSSTSAGHQSNTKFDWAQEHGSWFPGPTTPPSYL
jgi:hypothetical protein